MSDLPRLLFCCFDVVPGPSAISRRLTEYAKGLSERFEVVVLSVKTPDHAHIERYHGARLLRVPVGSGDLAARAQAFDRAVRRQLESEEYLVVHFFDPFGGYALAERRQELGYKLVYDACSLPSTEDADELEGGGRKLLARIRRQELFCLMNADAIIVANPLTRDWVATLGVERERVCLLPAPVDLGPYAAEAMGQPDATTMKVVHLGSLAAAHGLGVLVEGFALARERAALTLTLIGPSSPAARARLQEAVANRGLTDLVEFQEPVAHSDLHKVLATADVGALTLEDNEYNRVVGSALSRLGEYLAAGRPVIAADVPAARQLVPPEAAAWYQPHDPASLADALVALATDPLRRVQLGAAARTAAARWDALLVRADLVALYATLTGKAVPRVDANSEPVDANEVTQLGRSSIAAEAGEVTQMGSRKSGSGPKKVQVVDDAGGQRIGTEPAAARPDSATDAVAPGQRPAVMGVPLREDAPVVAGVELAPAELLNSEPPIVPGFELPPLVADLEVGPLRSPEGTRLYARLPDLHPADVAQPTPMVSGPDFGPSSADDLRFASLATPLPHDADEALEPTKSPLSLIEPPVSAPPTTLWSGLGEPGPSPRQQPGAQVTAPSAEPASASFETPLPYFPPLPDPMLGSGHSAPEAGTFALLSLPTPAPPLAKARPSLPLPALVPPSGSVHLVGAAAPPPLPGPSGPFANPSARPRLSADTPAITAPAITAPSVTAPGVTAPGVTAPGISAPRSAAGPIPSLVQGVRAPPQLEEELLEISDHEVEEVPELVGEDDAVMAADDSVQTVELDTSLPDSAIDPWHAQLVHGYCPPGSHLFDRPVPPTTMPGRDP